VDHRKTDDNLVVVVAHDHNNNGLLLVVFVAGARRCPSARPTTHCVWAFVPRRTRRRGATSRPPLHHRPPYRRPWAGLPRLPPAGRTTTRLYEEEEEKKMYNNNNDAFLVSSKEKKGLWLVPEQQ
jgi:hypothetical protein